mgnify:CR=1 FL=1
MLRVVGKRLPAMKLGQPRSTRLSRMRYHVAATCRPIDTARQRCAAGHHGRGLCSSSEDDGPVIGPVDTIWKGPEIGEMADQYCSGCGAHFRGLVTAETRTTRHVFPCRPLGRKCARCAALEADDLQACSDETREVEPEAFVEDMAQILARGPALCVKIVDAADFDATCIAATLREIEAN